MRVTACAFLVCSGLLIVGLAWGGPPAGYGQPGGEFDITLSRVPTSDRATAKALKPPFQPTPEILEEGKAIFLGRGTCFQCHGNEGKGDGGAAKVLPIQPRNFTNPKFNKVRTPGEMMWVLKNGSLGQTGDIPGIGARGNVIDFSSNHFSRNAQSQLIREGLAVGKIIGSEIAAEVSGRASGIIRTGNIP